MSRIVRIMIEDFVATLSLYFILLRKLNGFRNLRHDGLKKNQTNFIVSYILCYILFCSLTIQFLKWYTHKVVKFPYHQNRWCLVAIFLFFSFSFIWKAISSNQHTMEIFHLQWINSQVTIPKDQCLIGSWKVMMIFTVIRSYINQETSKCYCITNYIAFRSIFATVV